MQRGCSYDLDEKNPRKNPFLYIKIRMSVGRRVEGGVTICLSNILYVLIGNEDETNEG